MQCSLLLDLYIATFSAKKPYQDQRWIPVSSLVLPVQDPASVDCQCQTLFSHCNSIVLFTFGTILAFNWSIKAILDT